MKDSSSILRTIYENMIKSITKLVILASLLTCTLASVPGAQAQKTLAYNLFQAGVKAYSKGEYKEALRMFQQAVDLAEKANVKGRSMAIALNSIAETYRSLGQYTEAEAYYKKSLAICDTIKLKDDDALPLVYNSMALMYETQGRFSEAEMLWKQCEIAGRGSNLYPVNNLAYLYYKWGKTPEQLEYLNKAIKVGKRIKDPLAKAYQQFNSAIYSQAGGNYKAAEEEYKVSIATCVAQFGKSHLYYTVNLSELAQMYRQQSRYAEAEKTLREVLSIREGMFSPDHPDISEAKVALAQVLSEEGKYAEARDLISGALKTTREFFGTDDNPFVAKSKQCLGDIYRQDGRYQEASDLLNQALVTEKKILGSENLEVAIAMRDLALVDIEQANYDQAEERLKKSLSIIEHATGSDHPQRGAAANALAHFYLRNGKPAEAEPLFKKALELSTKSLGEINSVTAGSARELGELYAKQNQLGEATTYLQKALTIDEKLYGEKAPQVAGDLISLANVYGQQGKSADAEPLLKRVAEIKNVLPGGGGAAVDVPVATASGADRPVTDKWALVVGVSNFKDSSINLKFAAKDATDFKNFLVAKEKFKPDHVKLLTDEQATRENIIGLLGDKWLGTHVHTDDLVVVYISSHGSRSQDEAGGVNFLVAHDTNKNSLLATGIPMQWLTKMVKEQVQADRVILILDVCHSGSAAQGQKSLMRGEGLDKKQLNIGSGQMIICSSLADQVSWESKNYENSVFTRRLIEALQTNNQQTTMLQAYKQLKVLVESEVLRDRADLQTPVLWNKNWAGKDPVLGVESVSATHN